MDSTTPAGVSTLVGPSPVVGEPPTWLPDEASLLDLTQGSVGARASGAVATSRAELALTGEFSPIDVLAGWLLIHARLLGAARPSVWIGLDGATAVRLTTKYEATIPWRAWRERVRLAFEACASVVPVHAQEGISSTAIVLRGLSGHHPSLQFDYPSDRLDRTTMASLIDAVVAIVRHAKLPASADLPLEHIEHVGAVTRESLIELGRGPQVGIRADETLVSLFDAQADAHPASIAVAGGAQAGELSYAELQVRSREFAAVIESVVTLSGKHRPIIALAIERSVDVVVAMLGILRAGAAYLPIDARMPAEKSRELLLGAAVRVVVVDDASATRFDDFTRIRVGSTAAAVGAVVGVANGRLLAACDGIDATDPSVAATRSDNAAYLMFSSGSTGVPKGITIPHRAIIRLVKQAGFMRLGEGERMLHAAPLGFDASTLEIWGPLLNGGCCVIHPEATPSAKGLQKTIESQRVTSAWLTAALFNQIVDDRPQALSSLRQLVTGGEALSVPHVERLQAALPDLTLINGYGPTENTTFTTTATIAHAPAGTRRSIPIGRPVNNTECRVLGADRRLLPRGLIGELYVAGDGLALGYHADARLTAEKFLPDSHDAHAVWYRTGDLARWLPDGQLDYVGRADTQVKIRGFRIELSGVEAQLSALPGVDACVVLAHRHPVRGARLCAYVVGRASRDREFLLDALRASLPDYMVPADFVSLAQLPLTANGKVDRRALQPPTDQRPDLPHPYRTPQGEVELRVANVFMQVLGIDRAGRLDNFFELGGNSLLVMRALDLLNEGAAAPIPVATFYGDASVAALAAALMSPVESGTKLAVESNPSAASREPVAIIGMSGRFPGAATIEAFWHNLCEGRDTVRRFTDAELDASVPAALRNDSAYVRARGVLDDIDLFDASFFGVNPREAALMDPQQRVFLEICWEALERAGELPRGNIGVFGGMHNATYFQRHVSAHPQDVERVGEFQVMLANEKDYLASRTANRLNLKGPAISLNTACSTSLVAIGQAFDSVQAGHCDMALAGGVAINCPPNSGYLYQEGSMLSPDGHTRSFDADSQGTVFSDGAAVVLLKPLSRAIADGNPIFGVIRSVAVNNDGGDKASFTAPSVDGQQRVVAAALARAGIDAQTVSYLEAHGTATPLGDPVEVEALRRAYAPLTDRRNFCGIGSVKSNIGHTVMAAGATGVIKTVLAMTEGRIPATLHFKRPNPKIDFASTPFYVVDRITDWPRGDQPRRAGLSSFGVGGTNAHAILEEAPLTDESPTAVGPQLLRLSARSEQALQASARQLGEFIRRHPALNLADVAHTLEVGRTEFAHRFVLVAPADGTGVAQDLLAPDKAVRQGRAVKRKLGDRMLSPVWMFPGQGSQYLGMGRALGQQDAAFHQAYDAALSACDDGGFSHAAGGLRAVINGGDVDALNDTAVTQPAMFCIEYALARRWQAHGFEPVALIGHSIGEFAAAVIAGVMSLPQAARLVVRRGALMQALARGSMLSVRMDQASLEKILPARVALAAVNAPQACVVAGPTADVQAFEQALQAIGVATRLLRTSHAFHSPMMDDAVAPFQSLVATTALQAPSIPIFSTLRGRLLRDNEAVDPAYWSAHLREAVRFDPALRSALAAYPDAMLMEMGPRTVLCTLARQQSVQGVSTPIAVASMGEAVDEEIAALRLALGQMWTLGVEPRAVTSAALTSGLSGRRRVVLPTYPFERQRFWVDTGVSATDLKPSSLAQAGPVLMTTAALEPRRTRLISGLRDVFEETSGLSLADADIGASFVELGLDSLMLTQVALQLKKRYAVPISFRQLMESLRCLDDLAAHLDEALPAEALPAAADPAAVALTGSAVAGPAFAAPAFAAPALAAPDLSVAATWASLASPGQAWSPMAAIQGALPFAPMPGIAMPAGIGGANDSLIQQVISQQMQLLSQQLALLAGAGAVVALPNAPATSATSATAHPGLSDASSKAASAAAAAIATASSGQNSSAPSNVPANPSPGTLDGTTVTSNPPSTPVATQTDADAPQKATYDVKKAFGAIARIRKQDSDLSELQRARLAALIRRYVARTQKSKDYTQRHRAQLSDPRVVNGFSPKLKEMIYQIVVERSKGAHMWDLDGNQYVDVLNGFGMSLFGWQPDFVLDAVRQQLDAGYEIGPQHPLAGEVADLICELTGFDRAALCNTGSEAVMAAVRMARTVTGRDTVVLFSGSYHGTFDEVLVRQGRNMKGLPAAPGIQPGMFGDVRVLEYGTQESLEYIRTHADELAAVLVEPVQSRRPDFQPKEYLKEIRAITREKGACLIFDEVITGFRAHLGGVQKLFGIQADLATYGKVIGGGFPVGVVAGRREYMDALDGGSWNYGDDSVPTIGVTYFAGTFVRHPLALAACKASLLHLKNSGEALQTQLNLHTAGLADELNAFCREAGAPIQIKYFSSLWRVAMLEDHPMQDLLFAMMRTRGVHILDNFPCFLTTAHTPEDIALIKTAFKESVAELQASDFLPRRAVEPTTLDASRPPVPDARLGRGKDGRPAWFVPDPQAAGKFKKLSA